ncbi:MAG: hypothetical protein M3Z05_21440 [Gemmatimonadota bacterium]|nr:hypothetical protein [Gemmatimonadota bacterium]
MLPSRTCRLVLLASCFAVSSAYAQATVDTSHAFRMYFAAGTSLAQRIPDVNGFHADMGVTRGVGGGVGAELELTQHVYAQTPIYPRLIIDAEGRGYQTVSRDVTAGIASFTVDVLPLSGGARLSLLAGIGAYYSHREAIHYPPCEEGAICTGERQRLDFRALQTGISGGARASFMLHHLPAFVDLRLHYMYRSVPEGRPGDDYLLLPLSFGLFL